MGFLAKSLCLGVFFGPEARVLAKVLGEHPGDHNHQNFPKSTAIRMGGVLQCKWGAYCDTNGRSTDNISFSSERRGTESTAIQIGGVSQYKKWRPIAILFEK